MISVQGSGGGGDNSSNLKHYSGTITLASSAKEITIANPFGNAESVKQFNIKLANPTSSNQYYFVMANIAINNIFFAKRDYNGNPAFGLHPGNITTEITDSTITLSSLSPYFHAGDVAWEVIGVKE